MDTWSIAQDGFAARTAQAFEGLFTLGSGYLHTRGSLEEHFADCPQNSRVLRKPANVTAESFAVAPGRWGTYVPGIFGHHPLLLQEMVNLPWFLEWVPVVDGERLDATRSRVRGFRRVLNLKTATLTRSLEWHTRAGCRLTITHERFISGARPALSVQRLRVQADRPVTIAIRAGIDANVTTNGFDHFRAVELGPAGSHGVGCAVVTDAGDTVRLECRLRGREAPWEYRRGERRAHREAAFAVAPDRPLELEKRTAVVTSRDLSPRTARDVLASAEPLDWGDLHREHTRHWEEAWASADVAIGGDDRTQLILRASIYHLLRAHVPGDDRVAIGAKGYAGEAYKGHFFWDTEIYLLPFFLYTAPEKARTLVDFRIRCLPRARKLAAAFGYRGARFPWESDADGLECCSNFQYRDHQIHVTADVVYGLAHYGAAAGTGAMAADAARLVVETARYWRDRVDWRTGDDYPSLLGVMGPDEYAPITANNAYTNRLAAFNLALAARVGAQGGATAGEIAEFARLAETLPIPRSARDPRLVLQCEHFERLAEPRFDEFWADRRGCYAARVSQERLYRSKNLKQADVLLLMMLFPDEFTDEEVRAAWDTYLPLTTHDSSLSAGIHAIVALRLGKHEDAWRLFQQSAAIDLDTEHGGAAQGIHIAGCAANWQVVVFGFAGVRSALQSEILSLSPRLPRPWTRLAFRLIWKGTPVRIEIGASSCLLTNEGDTPLEAAVHGSRRRLSPGRTARFALPNPGGRKEA